MQHTHRPELSVPGTRHGIRFSAFTSRAVLLLAGGVVVAAAAVVLRVDGMGATFESSDQAAMAYLVRHSYGIRWILAHEYGPVLPLMQRIAAEGLELARITQGEWAARLPVALASLALVGVMYPLSSRLGGARPEALAAAGVAAVLPGLVSDAHYAWGWQTLLVTSGAVALWATLRFMDQRDVRSGAVAAGALLVHCLCGLYAFALPAALMCAWGMCLRQGQCTVAADTLRKRVLLPLVVFVAPCVAALGVIFVCWHATGGGQIGRLMSKSDMGAVGLHFGQVLSLPHIWIAHLGHAFGLAGVVGLAWGTWQLVRGRRVGLLAVWAWAALLPIVLMVDWNCTGYPNYYFFEPVIASALLGVLVLGRLLRQSSRGGALIAAAVGLIGCAQLVAGSVNVVRPNEQLARWSGTHAGWGDVRGDSGVKGTGWYVRNFVPDDAVVMSIHTRDGMELPVAEYYCGRKVLAHYDVLESALGPLLAATQDSADVLLVDAGHAALIEERPGWEAVLTLRHHDEPARYVFARTGLRLRRIELDVGEASEVYDAMFRPDRVPLPLPAGPGFTAALRRYQDAIQELAATRFAGVRPSF